MLCVGKTNRDQTETLSRTERRIECPGRLLAVAIIRSHERSSAPRRSWRFPACASSQTFSWRCERQMLHPATGTDIMRRMELDVS